MLLLPGFAGGLQNGVLKSARRAGSANAATAPEASLAPGLGRGRRPVVSRGARLAARLPNQVLVRCRGAGRAASADVARLGLVRARGARAADTVRRHGRLGVGVRARGARPWCVARFGQVRAGGLVLARGALQAHLALKVGANERTVCDKEGWHCPFCWGRTYSVSGGGAVLTQVFSFGARLPGCAAVASVAGGWLVLARLGKYRGRGGRKRLRGGGQLGGDHRRRSGRAVAVHLVETRAGTRCCAFLSLLTCSFSKPPRFLRSAPPPTYGAHGADAVRAGCGRLAGVKAGAALSGRFAACGRVAGGILEGLRATRGTLERRGASGEI